MLSQLRPVFARVLDPVGRGMARLGITPNLVTMVGTAGVAASALYFYPRGQLFAGTVVVTVFVLADMLDGAVARATGGSSRWGAFLDSSFDRVSDAAIFCGLILYLLRVDGGAPLVGLALLCLVAGLLVSYVKARAEGLGLRCDVGIAERTERLVILLVTIGLTGAGVPYLMWGGLGVLAVLSVVTVVQRVAAVYRQTHAAETVGGT
ncbi:phosphatidylinositol phosphate synthase [Allonocardiopsis opalescens]|uniref:Phosphatidylinositol phosphate synthase n=1 Tax=Allonocardiopsis opalescens TaxID=1144618 RepID=A0A2T0PX00_9ACTN|nr:CDP-alcohol phosphatidyltransferase family protein [Allonocardiopsis opalescens]PRX96064.1 CDP-diacylglycerol--glycerol-3-phosphate 3-phosphatidyltransferase [Allonocardiopsis opalescens]